MPNIRMPDGKVVRFPDDMPPDQIKSLIASKFPELAQPSLGGFMTNAAQDTKNVFGGLAEAVSNPKQTVKQLGKLAVGTVQEFIPGQQQYETEVADPFYNQFNKDVGLSWSGALPEMDVKQFAKTAYEKPLSQLLNVGMVAAPAEALPGRIGRVARTVNQVNPISLAGRGVTSVAKRAITPFPGRGASGQAANVLAGEGVRVTAGQRTGNKALKYAESEIGGNRTSRIMDEQGEQFTRAASHRIGEDTPHLDGETMNNAYDRIGGDIGNIARAHTLTTSNALMRDTYNAAGNYNRRVPASQRVPMVDQFRTEIQALRGTVPGDIYQDLRSRIGAEARATKDPHVQHALYGMQRALDDAFEQTLPAGAAEAMREARRHYRNYLVLEDAMATGGQATAAGILTPAKLEQAASSRLGRRAYLHGHNDFRDLAKAGKVAMTAMPESGTSARLAINAIPAAIGGAIGGGGAGAIGAVAGALAGRNIAGRALMSRPVQGYLGNQLMPPGTTRAGRIAGSVGRPLATAAIKTREDTLKRTRAESLKHAENVVSPQVMDHIKKSPATRGLLNDWLKARHAGNADEATQVLAAAIVKELKIDDPSVYDRIISELNQSKGPH
jgi:hypothetical protein